MADNLSREKRSKIMRSVVQKDTRPELSLRKALWKKGYRYRIHYGKPIIDIAFVSKKIAVFVDGCFWHMCPKHSHFPKSRKSYWVPKLKRNAARDKETRELLKKRGWIIVRVWEHDINQDIEHCIILVETALNGR